MFWHILLASGSNIEPCVKNDSDWNDYTSNKIQREQETIKEMSQGQIADKEVCGFSFTDMETNF